METAWRTVVNVFYRRMNDLDKRKEFPNAVIIDHAVSERFLFQRWHMVNKLGRLAMIFDVVKDERLQ